MSYLKSYTCLVFSMLITSLLMGQVASSVQTSAQVTEDLAFTVGGIYLEGAMVSGTLAQVLAESGTVASVDVDLPRLDLYPNPTTDRLYLPYDISAQPISICDAAGRQIASYSSTSGHLNVRGLPSGIYYLYIEGYSPFTFQKIDK